MSSIIKKRLRRAKKKAAAGKQVRPVGGHPGAGDILGKGAAVAGSLGKQLLGHFTGIDLGELAGAAGVGGAAATGLPAHMFGGRRRRMRATNVKALRRAIRRVEAFGRIAKKVIRFSHPHQRGRMYFKTRRKRRAA